MWYQEKSQRFLISPLRSHQLAKITPIGSLKLHIPQVSVLHRINEIWGKPQVSNFSQPWALSLLRHPLSFLSWWTSCLESFIFSMEQQLLTHKYIFPYRMSHRPIDTVRCFTGTRRPKYPPRELTESPPKKSTVYLALTVVSAVIVWCLLFLLSKFWNEATHPVFFWLAC